MQVSGILSLVEAQKAGGLARRIVFGAGRFLSLLGVALWVLCAWAIMAALDLGLPPVLALVIGVIVIVVLAVGTRCACAIWSRSKLRSRGAEDNYAMAFEVVPEGLRVKSKLSESLHYWSTFEELSESGGYWLFVLLGTAVVLPKRFFPTSEAERAFIAAAWRHLDDIARSRSTKTASYLASAA